jgi:Protein of unknown function with HXXEE motif
MGGEPGGGPRVRAGRASRRAAAPRFCRAVWVFPAVFAAHVLEEAPGFAAWARRHGSTRYTQADFVRNNALGVAMTVAGSYLASRTRRPSAVFAYFAIVLTQQALFNTLFHAGATVAYREYSPGVVTAVGGFLPVWWHLTRIARREKLLTRQGALAAAGIGGAIHATAVVQQVYRR